MKRIFLLFLAGSLAGCTSLVGGGRYSEQETGAINGLQADIFQLKSVVQELEESNRRLISDMETMRSVNDAKGRAFEDALGSIKQDLNRARSENDRMKSEIIAEISRKVADLMRPSAPARGGDVGRYHVVAAGDTLLAISAAYGKSADVIVKANNLKDVNSIRVGQKLFIPE